MPALVRAVESCVSRGNVRSGATSAPRVKGTKTVSGEGESSTLSALLDEITSHLFLTGTPGVGEHQVRGWLQRVAQEFEALQIRNRKLSVRVAEFERDLGDRRHVTEEQLLAELPGRTARVLRSAQEVGEEIVQRAKEHAGVLAQEAGQHAAEVRRRAETEAQNVLRRAETDAQAQLDAARSSGRDIVMQARELRQRTLTDLNERRVALEQEVERLQTGRDRLLEAYVAMKRTFDEATSSFSRDDLTGVDPAPAPRPPRRRPGERALQQRRGHNGEQPPPDAGRALAPVENGGRPAAGPPSRYTVRVSPSTDQPTSRTVEEWSRMLGT